MPTPRKKSGSTEDNNDLAGQLPQKPDSRLKKLGALLIGRWRMHGPTIDGIVEFEWMEGGHFLLHKFDLKTEGENPKGVEYIGWNEKTRTLRSRLFGIDGSRFTYTWELRARQLTIWFGDPGAKVVSRGRIVSKKQIQAAWKGPDVDGKPSGYTYTLDRLG